MIVAGCDIGSLTSKMVIMDNDQIISYAVVKSGTNPTKSAENVLNMALQKANLNLQDIKVAIGTGYGKQKIEFANYSESEISCHAMGAWFNDNSIRTVVDIGGQDSKAIHLDENGNVTRYVYNDKCASGTGRFLEIMADALGINIEQMGTISEKSTKKLQISSQCVIFAETELISLVNEGNEIADIVFALNTAMAKRAASLAKSIGVNENVAFTGGVAKNSSVYKALEKSLGITLRPIRIDPQINGALGAALFAKQKL